MSEEYGPDFVSVTDDEGNEFELEHLGTLEYNGQEYMAFVPADMDEDNATAEATEAIYRLVAAVLNNNMGKVPVTEEDVADYDVEERTAILNAYMEFVNELKQNPN